MQSVVAEPEKKPVLTKLPEQASSPSSASSTDSSSSSSSSTSSEASMMAALLDSAEISAELQRQKVGLYRQMLLELMDSLQASNMLSSDLLKNFYYIAVCSALKTEMDGKKEELSQRDDALAAASEQEREQEEAKKSTSRRKTKQQQQQTQREDEKKRENEKRRLADDISIVGLMDAHEEWRDILACLYALQSEEEIKDMVLEGAIIFEGLVRDSESLIENLLHFATTITMLSSVTSEWTLKPVFGGGSQVETTPGVSTASTPTNPEEYVPRERNTYNASAKSGARASTRADATNVSQPSSSAPQPASTTFSPSQGVQEAQRSRYSEDEVHHLHPCYNPECQKRQLRRPPTGLHYHRTISKPLAKPSQEAEESTRKESEEQTKAQQPKPKRSVFPPSSKRNRLVARHPQGLGHVEFVREMRRLPLDLALEAEGFATPTFIEARHIQTHVRRAR